MADQVAENVATSEPVAVAPEITRNNSETVHADKSANTDAEAPKTPPVKGPADDLRSIQNLLVSGIFPGNLAPAVVQGFRLLDEMAKAVEAGSLKMTKESK